jgi:hypothetical protein
MQIHIDSCTGSELCDTFANAYNYIWTQDSETGIIWFHPKDCLYEDIMDQQIKIEADQLAVPMLSGVVLALASHSGELRFGNSTRMSSGALGTYDYPVDIPAGTFCIRDILNLCCTGDPARMFFINCLGNENRVQALNLARPKGQRMDHPPSGALAYWKTEIGPLINEMPPTNEQMLKLVMGSNRRLSKAALGYFSLMVYSARTVEYLLDQGLSKSEAIRLSLAAADVHVRDENSSCPEAEERLRIEATSDYLLTGDFELACLAALNIASLDKDLSALRTLCQRDYNEGNFLNIASDVARLCRQSETIHTALNMPEFKVLHDVLDKIGLVDTILDRPWPECRTLQFTVLESGK